ncbi:maestro heat-like repeat-containing protein family member 1 isoform X3 [Dreissena polymorpha]|uniref:maestro heat-like repeat-containing protein family member 1 isoform X3 n=1 Tax=Dreissena polymorpha TaxID=45954 RepID=UPI0022642783|nr:maestro heat-like repeat-containing protein family member 1 isoform X3 [Dreissena polymorpha]
MAGDEEEGVRFTGGQVDDLTMALIDSAFDRSEDCQDIIAISLFNLGKKKPELVLSSCYSYLQKHAKLAQGHRVVILQTMEKIIHEKLEVLDKDLAISLVKQASKELTQETDVIPEWQTAASGVLVALGKKYCNEVMENMLLKFQPGTLPHFFVVQTIANLCSVNVYGMVPHLTAVLGTMLPMLGMAKQDNMRWVFSSAISKFSEAIIDYIANIDKAPDTSVKKEMFSSEIFSAYDVIFNVWIQSKEVKLRLAIVEALGHMTHLMARDKLEEQLPRILAGILGLYKKHQEPFHITQGLCSVLDAICEGGSTILEPHLEHVLNALFPQIFAPVDFNNPMSMKNQNEVLRCFAVIAGSFSGKLTGILLQKLDQNNEKMKIGILTIFKHLINAAAPAMEDKKEVVLSGLKGISQEPSNKVKKVFAQVVIAMGHHGYMELEGGTNMIEFIAIQCSLQDEPPGTKRSPDPDHVTNTQLRHMCDNVLQLLTNTVEQMENVLWPYLLELVVPEKYTEGSGVICRCLATIANKKREANAEDYDLDYETQANLPKPCNVIARLMTLAGRPLNGRQRGVHVLNLMKGLAPNLHDNLTELWDTVIPKLVQYLEDPEKTESWSQKSWEDLLLKMLSKSLDVVDHEEWIAELGETFAQHIPMYTRLPEEKNFLYKCIGIVMRKSTKKDFVNRMLDQVFNTVRHTDQIEREGCAVCLGFCATSHLDAVLTKLESVTKADLSQKKSGVFSFMKSEKSEGDVERMKATLMLCYGFVALYSPPTLIISRMEATILRSIQPYFANVKDSTVKQNLIRAVDQIGQALHPDHLGQKYNFSNRGEFISHLQAYMQAESTQHITSDTRLLALNACTTLIKLDPILSEADLFDLIKTATDFVFPLPLDGGAAGSKKGKGEGMDPDEVEVLMEATVEALDDLLTQILSKDITMATFDSILKHLIPWYLSVHDHERQRAVRMTHVLLKYLLENIETKAQKFENLHILLARLVPRCSDPCIEVRQLSMDCIQASLHLAQRCSGIGSDHKDPMVEALPTLRARLEKGDPNVLYSVVNDLSKVISKKLPSEQLKAFIELIQEGLLDPQSHSSSGACVVLNGLMKNRGTELLKEVDAILSSIHEKLFQIQFPQTKTGALRAVRTLAQHHLFQVLKSLLGYSLPFDENVVEIWKILSSDPQLVAVMLDHMLELYGKSLPYEEKQPDDKKEPVRRATQTPLAITCALVEILQVEETEEQVKKSYHRLFAALLVRIGSSVGVEPLKPAQSEPAAKDKKKGVPPPTSSKQVKPSSVAVDAFKKFLANTKSDDITQVLEEGQCWGKLEDREELPGAINTLTKALVTSTVGGEYVSKIVSSLTSYMSSLYDPQRVVVAAFFAQLIEEKCMGDDTLVELVMNSLLGRLVDQSHIVRQMCIRGLGNVARIGKAQVQHYSTTVLSAMMAGMDDKEDPEDDITVEAMSGLSRVLSEIDEKHIRAILINVALRIRPCFEKEKPNVRAQSIILFGNLSAFGDGPSKLPFLEQIHSNFVSLLLHLNDPDNDVKKACKSALKQVGTLIGSDSINKMFQKFLLEESNLHYGEFMNDLSKLIIQDFPEKVNFYVMGCVSFYKSVWPEIKSNAALFTGFLLGNLPEERQGVISKEHVCAALILLLKDPTPSVRSTAAEAMSLLDKY